MDKNLDIIAKELFGKLRTQFPKIQLGDQDSKVTNEPKSARFFEFSFSKNGVDLGNVTVSLDEGDDTDPSSLIVLYSNDVVENETDGTKKLWFNFLRELREFAKQRFLNFDTRDIAKSNLEKRDYEQLARNGDGNMTESKLFGTSKTSYQAMGEAKIIVKHSQPVNYDLPAGRTMHIESIYIENAAGERFRYPFKHLNGARAMAQHVAHGGTPYDAIGEHVIGLSEELSKLRMFKGYVDRNPVVAESMVTIRTKVAERIDSVKKEIRSLQNQNYYSSFVETFEQPTAREIPEEILNDWVDRLTIRTFNEELKNVFPYIYNLVDESELPVKELGVEDLINSESLDVQDQVTNEIEELQNFESYLEKLVAESSDLFNSNSDVQNSAVERLNELVAEPIPVGVDGTNAIESLQGIIDDKELADVFEELADVNPEADARTVLKDYIKQKDADVFEKISFGEEPVDTSVPPVAEPAAVAEPAPAPANQPVTASLEREGNAFASAVQKAKAAGMKPGDKFKMGEKEYTLQDAIEMAGMQLEDFFSEADGPDNEIVEFIKSMYDYTTGRFPKGETGVMLAVEKQFGEHATKIAHNVISELSHVYESQRIMKLAGLPTNEQSPADQIAKDTQALGMNMKPQQFAPGEVKPSQIFGHPQWLTTVQAMHRKYPGNKDQAMQAAKDAVTQLIKQGK